MSLGELGRKAAAIREEMDRIIVESVDAGIPYAEIGQAFDPPITRQAVAQRYALLTRNRTE